jgi:hypothetical protein
LPSDANITEITFSVYFVKGDTGDVDDYVCSLFVMSRAWNGSEVTWNNATSNEKWEQLDLDTKFYDADLQDTIQYPGGGDRIFPCAAVAPLASVNHPWETFTITSAVQKYVKNPGSFHGLLLKPYLGNIGRWYAASEHTEQDKRPKLIIKYSGTGIVSNPQFKIASENLVKVTPENVQVFIPLKREYRVSILDIKGRTIHSFNGIGETWHKVPETGLTDGMNILYATDGYSKIVQKFFVVK